MDSHERKTRTLRRSNAESRRVTREAVRGALFRMLQSTRLREIKIVDLVRIAGISRSAFYRNYASVEDVLMDAIDAPIQQIQDAVSKNSAENWRMIICAVRDNEAQLKVLAESGLFHVLLDRMNAGCDPADYRMAMWNGLIFSVIHRWVQNGMHESDEAILGVIDGESRRLAHAIQNA